MGKGSWSGIWEMFAALVFYDLVTTMVMIMWKDGEVLAVQLSLIHILKASAAGKVGGTGRYEMIHEKAPFWTWRWTRVRSCFILERNSVIFRGAQTGRIMVIDIGYQEAGENMSDIVQN